MPAKITDLTNITGAALADADEFEVVDQDGAAGPAPASRAITLEQLKVAIGGGVTQGTAQTATGAETELDFAIPSGAKRVTIAFSGLEHDDTDPVIVRIGDSGGVETAGYAGGIHTGTASVAKTSGFGAAGNNSVGATNELHGVAELVLLDASSNLWSYKAAIWLTGTDAIYHSAGSRALDGELTTVRITTTDATEEFESGSVNVQVFE